MRTIFALLFSLTVVSVGVALDVVTDPQKEALLLSTVTLKCTFTPPSTHANQILLRWHFAPNGGPDHVMYSRTDGSGGTAYRQFLGRASITGTRGDLTISKLTREDEGIYTCDVDFYISKEKGMSTTTLVINNVPDMVDIVDYGRQEYVYVQTGTTIMFECRATNAKPAPTLNWYKGTTKIDTASEQKVSNPDGTFNTISQLSFKSELEDHNQPLKCESNQEPSIVGQYKSDSIIINTSGAITKSLSALLMVASIIIGQIWIQ